MQHSPTSLECGRPTNINIALHPARKAETFLSQINFVENVLDPTDQIHFQRTIVPIFINQSLKVWEVPSGNSGSSNHTTNSNHGKTSILQLSKLHLVLLLFGFWVESKWIKGKVTRSTVVLSHVGEGGDGAGFEDGDPKEDLDHGVREFVVSFNNVGDGIEGELCARDADKFWDDESNGGKHGTGIASRTWVAGIGV